MNDDKLHFEAKILAEIIVFSAFSAVLYVIRPFSLPYGGSITLGSMVPVMWISLRRGVRVGFVSGAIFGVLGLIIDVLLLPYSPITNPLQVFLEYPIAFGMIGLAGLFGTKPEWRVWLGAGVAVLVKFFIHVIAGIAFWYWSVPEGWNHVAWAVAYNGSFLLPEFIISAILLYILTKNKKILEYSL
jgi:thiamine transporter